MSDTITCQVEVAAHIAAYLMANGPSRDEQSLCQYRANSKSDCVQRCALGVLIPDNHYEKAYFEGTPASVATQWDSEHDSDLHRLWNAITEGLRVFFNANSFALTEDWQELLCETQSIHDSGPSENSPAWKCHILKGFAELIEEIEQGHYDSGQGGGPVYNRR